MIHAIITDFDGTLVDTFEANLRAYQMSFKTVGLILTADSYRRCYGLRYDCFMHEVGIMDEETKMAIKEAKKQYYPGFFELLKPNYALINLIDSFKAMGGMTAIASTARKENIVNAANYLGIADKFNLIFTGMDVKHSKPNPEIYSKAMMALGVSPEETLIFEDSKIGIAAAQASGAHYMVVDHRQFG